MKLKELAPLGLAVGILAGCGEAHQPPPIEKTPQYQIRAYHIGKAICYVAYHEYNNGYTSSMAMDCVEK